jgi:hypothetical protein
VARTALTVGWIVPLAEPYLRGFRPVLERGGSLRGYWFLSPSSQPSATRPSVTSPGRRSSPQVGFFVGFLADAEGFAYLVSQPPECLVFAFVVPIASAAHQRLVAAPDSLLRKTFTYIRWLTHRPPRFEFYEREATTLVRHTSMRAWPLTRYEHYSRNSFIETLAWLVRSGLVRKLREEPPPARAAQKASGPRRPTKRANSHAHHRKTS